MKKLMIHLYYGDPSEEFFLKLAQTVLDSGADILEIGIPYTDPVCDGAVFQRACKRALVGGINPIRVIKGIRKIRDMGYNQPIYVTSYFGPVFVFGVERFVRQVKKAGAQGIIAPDILLEEQGELLKIGRKHGISIIQFATPYSTRQRLTQILPAAEDFLYCISLPAVTGSTKKRIKEVVIIEKIKRLNKKIPVFVGFGIRNPEQVRKLIEKGANGVIVGSAVARIYEKHLKKPEKSLPEITQFIKSLKRATIENSTKLKT